VKSKKALRRPYLHKTDCDKGQFNLSNYNFAAWNDVTAYLKVKTRHAESHTYVESVCTRIYLVTR